MLHKLTTSHVWQVNPNGCGVSSSSIVTAVTITGAGASSFQVVENGRFLTDFGPLPTNVRANFTIRFAPTTGGVKNAVVHVANNDAVASDFTFSIVGSCIGR